MISIFAKPPFFMRHLQRVSSTIRGEQIAAYMGNARLNPPSGYEDDICIYVKPHIKPHEDYKFEKRSYLDIQDGFTLRHVLRKYPEVACIVFSDLDAETMPKYIENKIVLIPHHHMNFERHKRERDTIVTVGITGSAGAFQFIPQVIRDGLADRKVKLVEWSQFYPRRYVAKFHQGIDIHLQWRPWKKYDLQKKNQCQKNGWKNSMHLYLLRHFIMTWQRCALRKRRNITLIIYQSYIRS